MLPFISATFGPQGSGFPFARRIERTTCGLQNSESPTSDNLSPQETTAQEVGETGQDGGGLSCLDSSVVTKPDAIQG